MPNSDSNPIVEFAHGVIQTRFLPPPGGENRCPACGTQADEVRATQLLGCPLCYSVFEKLTESILHPEGS
ncbi:MAG TPA: hypothetical protein PLO61_01570 [Fimbriimonadaceae bacterium]|nr:hypothetical protein [Fimbriimonadaceae bacterium]